MSVQITTITVTLTPPVTMRTMGSAVPVTLDGKDPVALGMVLSVTIPMNVMVTTPVPLMPLVTTRLDLISVLAKMASLETEKIVKTTTSVTWEPTTAHQMPPVQTTTEVGIAPVMMDIAETA